MLDIPRTLGLADLIGVPPDDVRLEELSSLLPRAIADWTLGAGCPFTITYFTEDAAAVRHALETLGESASLALRGALPQAGLEVLGLVMSATAPTRLLWALVLPTTAGARSAASVAAALPAMAEASDLMARACGLGSLAVVGIETDVNGVVRSSVTYRVPSPRAAIRMLEEIACPATEGGNIFFQGLCGMGPKRPRPWPPLWVTRSEGADAAWTFTYLARCDAHREDDDTLLAAVADAGPARAWRSLTTPVPRVQALELVILDAERSAEPRWLVRLGDP